MEGAGVTRVLVLGDEAGNFDFRLQDGLLDIHVRPGLWVADHCCWAIQRKWERGDTRS
jgi:hypothetical protein